MEWTPDRIRLFRDAGLCLSQLKFAKQLGFDKRTIGNAERGAHPPSLALRRALDQALEQASDVQRNRFLTAVAALEENCTARDSKAWGTLTTSAENSSFGWFRVRSSLPTATRAVGMTDVRIIREMTQKFRNLDKAAFLHQPTVAIDLARAAEDHGKRAGVPALVAEASVMEAQALALAKDVKGCLVALHESERAFAAAEERDRPDWLGYFDGAYLAAIFGRCFRDIGRPAEAERFARCSLDMVDGYDRGRLFNLVLLAAVLADQRKVEEACQTASAALRIARDVRSVRTTANLVDLSRRLAPFRADPVVRMLNEEMRATGVLVHRA